MSAQSDGASLALGEGTYSTVEKDAERNVAIKTFRSANDIQAIQEIAILKYLDHVNIVKPTSVNLDVDGKWKIYMRCYAIDLSNNWRPLVRRHPLGVLSKIVMDVSSGLDYLHKNLVLHADMKPRNLLFDARSVVTVLCDFNLSVYNPSSSLSTRVQTPGYRAPEVILDDERGRFDYKIDVWSLGGIFYYLLTMKSFYQIVTNNSVKCAYAAFGLSECALQSSTLTLNHSQVVDRIVKRVMNTKWKRLNKMQLISSDHVNEFINTYIDMIASCLIPVPNSRATSEQIFELSKKLGKFYDANFNPYAVRVASQHTPLSLMFGSDEIVRSAIENLTEPIIKYTKDPVKLKDARDRLSWQLRTFIAIGTETTKWVQLIETKYYTAVKRKKILGTSEAMLATAACMYLIECITENKNEISQQYPRVIARPVLRNKAIEIFKTIGYNAIL